MTGLRDTWLLELLVVLPFLPPSIAPMLKSGVNVVRKTQGFRGGNCGIFSDERAASVVERAASTSRLFKRMFRGWMSSTLLNWRALALVALFERPGQLTRQVSTRTTNQLTRHCVPLQCLG